MKRALLILILIVMVIAGGVTWFVNRLPTSPFGGEVSTAAPSSELVQHGELVARQTDCVACHSTPDGKPFTGGLEMGTRSARSSPPTSPRTSRRASAIIPLPISTVPFDMA